MNKERHLYFIFSRYSRIPQDGKQAQFFKMIEIFSEFFDKIKILGLARSESDLKGPKPDLKDNVSLDELVTPGSYTIQALAYSTNNPLTEYISKKRIIKRWIKKHDSINGIFFLEGFPLAPFIESISKSKSIWGTVDSYLRRAKDFKRHEKRTKLEKIRYKIVQHIESAGIRKADKVHVYSEEDARFLRAHYGTHKIVSIPMLYNQENLHISNYPQHSDSKVKKALVWADGSYSHLEKSITAMAASKALSLSHNNYDFLIGKNAALNNRIEKMGYLVFDRIENLSKFIKSYDYVLLPDLYGTGIKNRTLHAISMGVPTIGFRHAWQGIPFTPRLGYKVTDYSEIESIVSETSEAEAIDKAQNGLKMVKEYFSRDVVSGQWIKLFQI